MYPVLEQHIAYNTLGQKSLRFLVIGRLQNPCGDTFFILFLVIFFFFFLFLPTSEIRGTCIRDCWNQTKFPLQKVHVHVHVCMYMVAERCGLTNRANVHTPTWLWTKNRLKHSTAESQSIHQFWLQLDIVSCPPPKKKCWCTGLRRRVQRPETRAFFGGEILASGDKQLI